MRPVLERWRSGLPLRAIGLALLASLAVAVGCEVLAGVEERSEVVRSRGTDAGGDTGIDAGDAAADAPDALPCLAHPPGPPAVADAGADDGGAEFVVAFRTISFEAQPTFGFDLDNMATTCADGEHAQPPSCQLPAMPLQNAWCDGECGRDLAGNDLLTEPAATTLGIGELSGRMEDGELGLLLRVSGYNGQADDGSVEVGAFVSPGTPFVGDAGRIPPEWDGNDSWTVADRLVTKKAGKIYSLTNSSRAYVSSRVLVAEFQQLLLGCSVRDNGLVLLRLERVVLTARIEASDGQSYLLTSGQMGGVLTSANFFALLQSVELVANNYLCPGQEPYPTVKNLVCKRVDLRLPAGDTNMPCNGLGMGATFTADPAKIYPILTEIPIAAPGCGDGGIPDDCP